VSQTNDAIAEYNAKSKEDNHNAALEHMAFLEQQRIASDFYTQNSVKGAWEKRRAKWAQSKLPKVLSNLIR
jgi:hypothetical protein